MNRFALLSLGSFIMTAAVFIGESIDGHYSWPPALFLVSAFVYAILSDMPRKP